MNFKSLGIFVVILIICMGCLSAQDADNYMVTILYDNTVSQEGLKSDWGFACTIEGAEKTILFDTGTKPEILYYNIEQLNIDINGIGQVILSHNHGDHSGGLLSFLEDNNDVTVYLPYTTPETFEEKVKKAGAEVRRENDPVEICENIYLTGEMGSRIKEQSFIFDTEAGLVVLTGCAHPGIVDIVKKAKEILNKDVYFVFGGFHLMQHSEEQVNSIISDFKDLGVKKVGATHCTGDKQIEMFRKAFGDNFVELGVGRIIEIAK